MAGGWFSPQQLGPEFWVPLPTQITWTVSCRGPYHLSDSSCAMAEGEGRAELKPVAALFLVMAQSKLRGRGAGSGPLAVL